MAAQFLHTPEQRRAKIAAGVCTYPGCERKAQRASTVCPQHHSGGRRLHKGERAAAKREQQS